MNRKRLAEGGVSDVGKKETKKNFLEFFSKPDKEIYRTDTPMDSPEVEEAREILDEGKIKYTDKEKKMKELGIDSEKMLKRRKLAKRLIDSVQGVRARKLTATEGSFKKGGLVKQGKPKLAKKGWR
jgi:ATP-dependent helicase YprA (DUF1998 family)